MSIQAILKILAISVDGDAAVQTVESKALMLSIAREQSFIEVSDGIVVELAIALAPEKRHATSRTETLPTPRDTLDRGKWPKDCCVPDCDANRFADPVRPVCSACSGRTFPNNSPTICSKAFVVPIPSHEWSMHTWSH